MKKAFSEIVLFCALLCLREALGDQKDHKNDFWRRFWIYQTKRLITEAKASMPTPMMVNNFVTILNSPIPSARTFTQLMYPLIGIGDMDETLKSGRHKGENKYIRNCMRYTIPFYNQLEQLHYMGEDDAVFYPFDASIGYK